MRQAARYATHASGGICALFMDFWTATPSRVNREQIGTSRLTASALKGASEPGLPDATAAATLAGRVCP